MTDPRKINLSLPADYIAKPAEKVRNWLQSNTASLRMLDESAVVAKVRSALGPQITALNDGDLAALAAEWAKANGIQRPAGGSGPGEAEIVSRLKRLFSSIPTSIEYACKNGGAQVSVSGATLLMKTGPLQHSATRSWGGNYEFKTEAPGVAFSVLLAEKEWRLMMSFGKLAPNLGDLESVFKKGEAAVRGALGNIDKLDPRNLSKSKQVIAPYIDPIKSAVTAASRAASLQAGDFSLGAWVGGGPVGGGVAGLQLTIIF
ncbi:MAG: hypothetical protein IPL03_01920 [Sterolibacteriaceae bacterium]|nr:hypothetical protein [Candidatus Methylophosphatis haderslevensis]